MSDGVVYILHPKVSWMGGGGKISRVEAKTGAYAVWAGSKSHILELASIWPQGKPGPDTFEGLAAGNGKLYATASGSNAVGGDAVVVSVSDDGGGIPEAIRERIFDPFFTTKEVGKGTGQGLPIARSVVVDKHGGEFTFETEVGKGTTFFIRLPIDGRRSPGSVSVDEELIG